MAIMSIASVTGGLFNLMVYITIGKFTLYALGLTFLFFKIKKINVDVLLLLFVGYLVLNIFLGDIPAVFNVKSRFGLFLLVIALFSHLIQNHLFREFRHVFLNSLFYLMIAVSVISFVCYFLGVNLMYRYGAFLDDYESSAGHFSGILGHSMLLGPIAGLSSVFLFHEYLNKKKRLILVLLIMCVGANMLAASRAAFGAMLIAQAYELYAVSKSKTAFLKRSLILGLILLLTFPIWNSGLSLLEKKQHSREIEDSGMYDSRTEKVENRLKEFYSSPIIGIGYQSVSMHSSDAPNIRGDGNIEPGSSWLCILSMTGIVGFLFMISIFRKAYKSALFAVDGNNVLLISLLIFYTVHMLVEGYVFAGGSFLCMHLWLIIGVCIDSKYMCQNDLC